MAAGGARERAAGRARESVREEVLLRLGELEPLELMDGTVNISNQNAALRTATRWCLGLGG